MLVNGFSDSYSQGCPVVGAFEDDGWNLQCPMADQWSRQTVNANLQCSYGDYNSNLQSPSVRCYRNFPFVPYGHENALSYYPLQEVYQQPVSYVPQRPMIQNLPCHQQPAWDYNSMCYNVDGQACQYTAVVDLEDFM